MPGNKTLTQSKVKNLDLEELYKAKIKEAADIYPEIDEDMNNKPSVDDYAKVVQSLWPISKALIIANTHNGFEKFMDVIEYFHDNELFTKLKNKEDFMRYVDANPHDRKRKYFTKKKNLPMWVDIYTVFYRVGHLYFSGKKRTVEVSHLD